MKEFDEAEKRISNNIQRIWEEEEPVRPLLVIGGAEKRISNKIQPIWEEPSIHPLAISEAVAKDAAASLIEFINPMILTPLHKIVIRGKVFLTSSPELVKVLKTKYTTPGVNIFPQIVDDFLEKGTSPQLSKLMSQYELSQTTQELRQLSRVIQRRKEGLVLLSGVDPISPVTEYTFDNKHTSGIPLKMIETPMIVLAERVSFQFISNSGAKISDGRLEKNMVIDLTNGGMIINEVENNIVTTSTEKKPGRWEDFITILAIILLGPGIAFLFTRRGGFWELGVLMTLVGAVLFYLRYFSQWVKERFAPAEVEIYGESIMNFKFYGELA